MRSTVNGKKGVDRSEHIPARPARAAASTSSRTGPISVKLPARVRLSEHMVPAAASLRPMSWQIVRTYVPFEQHSRSSQSLPD